MTITLPWPSPMLSPNSRVHRMALARHRRLARFEAKMLALGSIPPERRAELKAAGKASVVITFLPPDRRKRDDDGMICSFKAARDGIADAIGVDDGHWSVSYAIAEPIKGGEVRVEIQP